MRMPKDSNTIKINSLPKMVVVVCSPLRGNAIYLVVEGGVMKGELLGIDTNYWPYNMRTSTTA